MGVLKNERVDGSCGKALVKYSKEKLGFSQKKSSLLMQGIKAEVIQHFVRQHKSTLKITDRYLICGDKESEKKIVGNLFENR
jgi:hypothetical protein